jgi:hypothetical protein
MYTCKTVLNAKMISALIRAFRPLSVRQHTLKQRWADSASLSIRRQGEKPQVAARPAEGEAYAS